MKARNCIAQSNLLVVIAICFLIAGIAGAAMADSTDPNKLKPGDAQGMMSKPAVAEDSANKLLARAYRHYTISATNFHPLESTDLVQYDIAGCIYLTGGAWVTTPARLPEAATIKYLRLFYNVTSASKYMIARLVGYYPLSADFLTYATVTSPVNPGGRGYLDSSEMTVVVDSYTYDYTVYVYVQPGSDNKFCGVRIYYYNPPTLLLD